MVLEIMGLVFNKIYDDLEGLVQITLIISKVKKT